MQWTAPLPPGAGAVMWWASAVEAEPRISPRTAAPRARAISHSSSTSTAAPSVMTKPSRSMSKGRLTPLADRAVMLVNPAVAVGVNGASEPPAATMSQRPVEMSRAALPMAWVPAAQAVATFSHGPIQPYFIDRVADPALAIIIGTKNGDTRLGPLECSTPICSSRVVMPPTPVPISVPHRAGLAWISPAWATASAVAATTYWT